MKNATRYTALIHLAGTLLLGCGGDGRSEVGSTSGESGDVGGHPVASGGGGHAGASAGAGGSVAAGAGGGAGAAGGAGQAACAAEPGHVLAGAEALSAVSVAATASGARAFSVVSSGLGPSPSISLDGATLATTSVVVVELDAAGKLAWARPIPASVTDWTARFPVAMNAGGEVVVGGCFFGTVDLGGGVSASTPGYGAFVAKLSADGQPLWIRGFADDAQLCMQDVDVDAAGNVLVLGANGGVDLGTGALDGNGFLAKLDPSGAVLWAKGVVGLTAIAATPSGGVVGAGTLGGTADFGDGPMTADGIADVLVVSLDADGQLLFAKQYGDGEVQSASAVAVDAAGNLWVTGTLSGTIDFGGGALTGSDDAFVAKLDASGGHLHSRALPGEYALVNAIAPLPSGGVAIGGTFPATFDDGCGLLSAPHVIGLYSGDDVGSAAFVTWLDEAGACTSHHSFAPGGSEQSLHGLAADAHGRVTGVGQFAGAIDLGAGPTTSEDGWRGFVVALCGD